MGRCYLGGPEGTEGGHRGGTGEDRGGPGGDWVGVEGELVGLAGLEGGLLGLPGVEVGLPPKPGTVGRGGVGPGGTGDQVVERGLRSPTGPPGLHPVPPPPIPCTALRQGEATVSASCARARLP